MDVQLRKKQAFVLAKPEKWLPPAIFVAFLIFWEVGVRIGWISALFFPAPTDIIQSLSRLLVSGDLLTNLGATLSRLSAGFFIGGLSGFLLGMAMGWLPRFRAAVDPFIAAAHPVPKIAILPLIMIIFGIGETSKVIIIAVAAFFPMLINTMAGVREISPIYFDVAENYGASTRKLFTRVVIPGSLPLVLTGLRLSLNVALLLAIAVELVAAREGLGAMVWFAWETLRTEELYASLTIIAVLGIGFNYLIQQLRLILIPWQMEEED